jgi:hypothetical protein
MSIQTREYVVVTWAPGQFTGKPMRKTFQDVELARQALKAKLLTLPVNSMGWVYYVTTDAPLYPEYAKKHPTFVQRHWRKYWYIATFTDHEFYPKIFYETSWRRMTHARLRWWKYGELRGIQWKKVSA